MPIYDYRCQLCQISFTVQATMSAPSPTHGPECQAQNCEIHKSLNRVYGQITGANKAPNPAPQPNSKPKVKEPHVCAKYCDQHR